MRTKNSKKKKQSMASVADRHQLYELSVQCAESEIDFVDSTYKTIRGRRAQLLREDFCGTANVCCEWVKRRRTNKAIGVDLDPEVLNWGRTHSLGALKPGQQQRVELLEKNVLNVNTGSPDIISAMNFSYWLFKERKELKQYFTRVRKALADDGVFFMDAYGGYDSFREIVEERKIEAELLTFEYIWEQEKYNPINGNLICSIHFNFPDGSKIKRAFSYDWRLWTLPEITDLLDEVGFSRVTVYWQGWDKNGEPDGEFEPATEGEADAGWICYLTAEK